MAKILLQAWVVSKRGNEYFLPYTHWVYLNEIVKYYDEVGLLSPVKVMGEHEAGLVSLSSFNHVVVHELPYSDSYKAAVKHYKSYRAAYQQLNQYDIVYLRYPTPLGWLSKRFLGKKKRIVHFVGDPIDAAWVNPNFRTLKKLALISFFMPEHMAYIWACKGAKVFTNGHHLKQKLARWRINATPVISSTLNEADFHLDETKQLPRHGLKLLYVGYLRKAKGVEVVIKAFARVQQKYPGATLTIAGSGEFERELKMLVKDSSLEGKVTFLGHIDNRTTLNTLFRTHHIFCFASLSEGSPRVILEGMANGINILSTPVGSLPAVFKQEHDIMYADFNDEKAFSDRIAYLVEHPESAASLRKRAYEKVKEFTIQVFIKKIFTNEG
ncbi:glycosyltransferase family 4 protein [Chitinophaga arvensicola]|uniref:Glycosyltransferase involved in cell wall bisynthesis n=1 Tax=Chitinophaga arvensicola TaxID=29529 RepID=A0A1I0S8N4_9BACT|nr:glycosyltransferase family 4 protein [Chitinophaga arvensicola]SEW52474.1 Glycosyltransferase involved in cell wall bisynthesis [Chitinophaga arvensicola]